MLGMFSLPLLQLQLLPLPSTRCISASATGRLIISVQMLEIEYSAILGLAIGTIELGGGVCCIVTALRQRRWRRSRRRRGRGHLAQRQRWRFVQLQPDMMVTIVVIVIVGIRSDHSNSDALALCTPMMTMMMMMMTLRWWQHFVAAVAVAVARLQQRQI